MAASCVHHVQLAVRNGSRYVHKLISNVNFQLFAERNDVHRTDWVLRSGSAVFVVSEHRDEILPTLSGQFPENDSLGDRRGPGPRDRDEPSPARIAASDQNDRGPGASNSSNDLRTVAGLHRLGYVSPPLSPHNLDVTLPKSVLGNIDTVCNVAFEVCDVERTIAQAVRGGAQIVCEPTVIKDPSGFVTVAAIKSCVGNVVHTILNTDHYEGIFLPGFSDVRESNHLCNDNAANQVIFDKLDSISPSLNSKPAENEARVTHFDHVTFAIPTGSSNDVLDWYERCFGMRRFWLDRNEDKLEGFLVRGSNVGLRMKAMEYWRCAETGLVFPEQSTTRREESSEKETNMMFVVAEALPDQGSNQVETFIEQHGGPGIQHIGLYAPDIERTVESLMKRGLDFMVPPATYYTEVGKLEEMVLVGRDPAALRRLGILLDAEDFEEEGDSPNDQENDSKYIRYLMQVFTRPFFDRDTFFLEVIQRHGASGFGAGNIKALWRSVEAYMAQKDPRAVDTKKPRERLEY